MRRKFEVKRMVQRDSYLNRLIRNMWNGEIKVITGIRRCGKSVLLFDLFYNYLLSRGTAEDAIVRIELDQRRYYKYRNPIVLCEYIESIITGAPEKQFYFFIPEIAITLWRTSSADYFAQLQWFR